MYYCSLRDAKAELSSYGNTEQNTVRPDDVMRVVKTVTNRINQIMVGQSEDYIFLPQIKTRSVPIDGRHINSALNTLSLRWPLLALTALDANGSVITSNVAGYPSGEYPYQAIRANSNASSWYSYLGATCSDPAYAEVSGVWGWHSNYSEAWQDTGADLAAALTNSATSMLTTGVEDDDLWGFANRISRGMLAKIDDEYLWILGTTEANKKATIRRGVLGSTATTHDNEASIYCWQVEEPIRAVTARQAGLMLARRGAYQTEQVDGVTLGYPPDLLNELNRVLGEYING